MANKTLTHLVTLQFAVAGEEDAKKLVEHLTEHPGFLGGLKKGADVGRMINFSAVNNAPMQANKLRYCEKQLIAEVLGPDSVEL